jgi:hypothetical protein
MNPIILQIISQILALFKKTQSPKKQSIPENSLEVSVPASTPEISPISLTPVSQEEIAEAPSDPFVCTNIQKLSEEDFVEAANLLDIEVATIKSVTEVESKGGGYLASRRPKILFEAHLFSRFTSQKYNQTHPHIASPKWNKALYKGGEKEYDRLKEAMALDEKAALMSCSWGLFQILGSNHKACGFSTVQDFVQTQVESEKNQLLAFINFVKANRMDIHLRNKDFAAFARMYNGPGQVEYYSGKLKAAYDKFKE